VIFRSYLPLSSAAASLLCTSFYLESRLCSLSFIIRGLDDYTPPSRPIAFFFWLAAAPLPLSSFYELIPLRRPHPPSAFVDGEFFFDGSTRPSRHSLSASTAAFFSHPSPLPREFSPAGAWRRLPSQEFSFFLVVSRFASEVSIAPCIRPPWNPLSATPATPSLKGAEMRNLPFPQLSFFFLFSDLSDAPGLRGNLTLDRPGVPATLLSPARTKALPRIFLLLPFFSSRGASF